MKTPAFLAALGLALCGTALAAAPSKVDQAFARYDKNKDGFITRDELPPKHPMLDHMDMADKNRDGKLDKKEFAIALMMI